MPFEELQSGWSYSRMYTGAQGTRTFRKSAGGDVASLPDFGAQMEDPLGDSSMEVDSSGDVPFILPSCHLRTIRKTYAQGDTAPRYVCAYETPKRTPGTVGGEVGTTGEYEELRALSEAAVLDSDAGTGHKFTTGNHAVEFPIGKMIVTAAWVYKQNYTTRSAAVSGVAALLGKINSGGSSVGCWLFAGIDLDEGVGSNGAPLWTVRRNYAFRMVDTNGAKGWNYLWNKHESIWDTTDPLIYQSATLMDETFFPW